MPKKVLILSILMFFVLLVFGYFIFRLSGFTFIKNPVTGKKVFIYPGREVIYDSWRPDSGLPKPDWVVEDEPRVDESTTAFNVNLSVYDQYLKYKKEKLSQPSVENWNSKIDYMVSRVVSVDPELENLVLEVKIPNDMEFSYKLSGKYLTTKSICNEEVSAITDATGESITKDHINIFKEIVPGKHVLTTKCLNELCTEVGEVCIVSPVGETN